jgi:predicted ATPase
MNNWHVISGGPGTGKTTMIALLAARGYQTVPEAARAYIDTELKLGVKIEQIRDNQPAFQHAVLSLQLDAERGLDPESVVFLDRGIPDTLAYYRYHDLPDDEEIMKAVAACSYKQVFLLAPLPIVADYARKETAEAQRKICSVIHKVYDALPFPVVHVPVLPPEERVAFILSHL